MDRFTSFDGTEIAYQQWGNASTLPPVMLHHGFAANAQINWVGPGIVAALTNAGRQVIALDARGHGESEKPHDPIFYGEDKMGRDLRRLFDILGAKQFDLVGYSMGAMVSLAVASKETRIRRLVVGGVGSGVLATGGLDTRALARDALIDALQTSDPGTITEPTALGFRTFADRTGADRLALAAHIAARQAIAIDFSQISAPTLLIDGDADALATHPELLVAAIPNASLRILAGDHLGVVRNPEFAPAIVDFLAG